VYGDTVKKVLEEVVGVVAEEIPTFDVKAKLTKDLEGIDQQIKKNSYELNRLQARTEQLVGMANYAKALLSELSTDNAPKPDAS